MRRLVVTLALFTAVLAACFSVEQPQGGVQSISTLLSPWPSVVVGDTMRDSSGRATPLRVFGFGVHGDTVHAKAAFVLLDRGAHVALDSFLVGDSLRGPQQLRVVGSVAALQTPPFGLYVVPPPTHLRFLSRLDATGHTDTLFGSPDTSWSQNTLTTQLKVTGGVNDTAAVPGWIIYYTIRSMPAHRDTTASAYIVSSGLHAERNDTTDGSGTASPRVLIRGASLTDTALVLGHRTDSIVVEARAFYKGAPLSGSPVRYVVPVKFKALTP